MQPAKLNLHIGLLAYSSNGGVPGTIPEIAIWLFRLAGKLGPDERVGHVSIKTYGDTPLTMCRNSIVKDAQDLGADVLMMLDSDNAPDRYLGKDSSAKPFWESSFDFLYQRKLRGLPTVIFAPYCGPPPDDFGGEENVYVFRWANNASDERRPGLKLAALSRNEAALLTGIVEMSAGPTGVILYTLDAFDLMKPPYFYYEYPDKFQTNKASTEDVTNTRDIGMAGYEKFKEPVVFANMDAWAGHKKVKTVGRPTFIGVDTICETYREAVKLGLETGDKLQEVDFTKNLEPKGNGHASEPSPETEPEPSVKRLPVVGRMVYGQKVESLVHQTPVSELVALHAIVENMSEYRQGALRIIEVGSWVGESAVAMAKGLSRGGTVFCVDHWNGSDYLENVVQQYGSDSIYQRFEKNCGKLLNEVIKPMFGESLEIATSLDPQNADVVFIDASHDYESVCADIDAWKRHVAPDGILCGHDYSDEFPQVIQAVQERFGPVMRRYGDTSIWVVLMKDYLAQQANARELSAT